MMSAGLAARSFVQPSRHLSATLSAGLATRQFQHSFGPMGVQPARVGAGVARGVDLNLDEFNLSAATPVTRPEACIHLDGGADISGAFWLNIDPDFVSMFSEEDKRLLQKVFNPSLSDRREEGDLFVPPDTSAAYVQKLRVLVKEEEAVMKRRKDFFCSAAFTTEEPGHLFPSNWAASVEISHEAAAGKQGCVLHPRPDYKAQAQMFQQTLKSAVPAFDKSTEDGTRFRVYRLGSSLEVRTVQEPGAQEAIGAVFSRTSMEASKPQQRIKDQEKVVKATEYVERCSQGHRCYVVLETEGQNFLVVEEHRDGKLLSSENPKDLEDRNSLAKVIRSAECQDTNATVGSLKKCKKGIYSWVTGDEAECGFRRH